MQRRKLEEQKLEKDVAKVAAPKMEKLSTKVAFAGPPSEGRSEDRMKVLFNEANKELLNQIKCKSPNSAESAEDQLPDDPSAAAAPSAASAPSDFPKPEGPALSKQQQLFFQSEAAFASPAIAAAMNPPQFVLTKSVELAMDEQDGNIRPPPLNERFSASIFDMPLPERTASGYVLPYLQQPRPSTTTALSPPRQQKPQSQQQEPAVVPGNRRSNKDLIDDDDDDDEDEDDAKQPSKITVVWQI